MLQEQTFAGVNAAADGLLADSAAVPVQKRIELCQECLDGVAAVTDEWVQLAACGKGLSPDSAWRAEDLLSGPAVVARQLQLTIQTLSAIHRHARPELPRKPVQLQNGQVAVPVFPTRGLYDSLTFMGIRGNVRLHPGVSEREIHGQLLEKAGNANLQTITAVLGAGNVSSIPATDSLNRIMFEGSKVLLKLNPVNAYLQSVFERAFAPLIKANLLRILTGGSEVGEALIQHAAVTDVHITGSAATHDMIVWGKDPQERLRRKHANDPLLKKHVTSELGNVTPWIVVPGVYSSRELDSQARHIAASITNNVSFNCLASKIIVTWKHWSQREDFLKRIQRHLALTPLRPAYYPGAVERFHRFSGTRIQPNERGCLPWTLLTGMSIDERPELFNEESFVCVCAETQLSEDTPSRFLVAATEFVNDRVNGTLCASVTIPPGFRSKHGDTLEACINRLRYGSVCVNQWSGLAYGLTSPPWGAWPGATLKDVQSGIGNVHNTYLLDQIEKTVMEGPLVNFPKPIWFPSHRNAVSVATQLVRLYHRPSILKLPQLFAAAIRG
ncbi:MAG: aldehyde dehydrogenase family protein [Planctomycetaceae bacterium]